MCICERERLCVVCESVLAEWRRAWGMASQTQCGFKMCGTVSYSNHLISFHLTVSGGLIL